MDEEELKSTNQNREEDDAENNNGEEELFLESFDDSSRYDCNEIFRDQSESNCEVLLSDSASSTLDSVSVSNKFDQVNLCRRRRFSFGNNGVMESNGVFRDNYLGSGAIMLKKFGKNDDNNDNNKEGNGMLFTNINEPDEIKLILKKEDDEISKKEHPTNSGISYVDTKKDDDFVEAESNSIETRAANSSFLIILPVLVFKAIRFQFGLLCCFFIFPIWLMYISYMFVMDPCRVLRRVRGYMIKIACRVLGRLWASVLKWLNHRKHFFKWGLKFGWGLLCSVYVWTVLGALFVSAFVAGGLLVRIMVEEPMRMEEHLDLDYTQKSPMAFVPIMTNHEIGYSLSGMENLEVQKFDGIRPIPPKHKLQAKISMTLPETDYNINLGIFQIRVDFLAAGGQVLASTRRPCMLKFKSHPIRMLLTFLKAAPLLIGYSSETQDINLEFKGFIEGTTPTSYIRVTIEPRAQFQPTSGVPEIYSASLVLESQQPLLKGIIWSWRKTLYVWISLTIFIVELVFALFFCRPIIIPIVRLRTSPTNVTGARSK